MCQTDILFPTLACGNCAFQVFIVDICWSMTNSPQTMSLMFRKATKWSKMKSVKGQCLLLEHSWTSIHQTQSLISMYISVFCFAHTKDEMWHSWEISSRHFCKKTHLNSEVLQLFVQSLHYSILVRILRRIMRKKIWTGKITLVCHNIEKEIIISISNILPFCKIIYCLLYKLNNVSFHLCAMFNKLKSLKTIQCNIDRFLYQIYYLIPLTYFIIILYIWYFIMISLMILKLVNKKMQRFIWDKTGKSLPMSEDLKSLVNATNTPQNNKLLKVAHTHIQ